MKPFILFALLLSVITAQTQIPNLQWARGFGSADIVNGTSIATDPSGNVYVTGYFTDTLLIFGADTLVNSATNGAQNMFIAKYDSSGNPLWARSAGGGANEGTENVTAYGLGTDASGNVYVIGSFQTPFVIFGADTLITNNDYSFLARFDSQGNTVWAINLGGTLNTATSIAVDASGNSYICGDFTSGSIIGGTDTVPMSGYVASYVIKYDSSGNSLWAAGVTGNITINYAVAIDAASNVYVTGSYSGDTAQAGNVILSDPGEARAGIYTIKYDASGSIAWAQNATVRGLIFPSAIGADKAGDVYITGYTLADTLVFGADTGYTGTTAAPDNFFIAKYDSSGNIRWLRNTTGYNDATPTAISVDDAGNAFVTGSFAYGPLTIGNTTLANNDTFHQQAVFIAQYDPSGNPVWATGGLAPTLDIDAGAAIVFDNKGHLYVAGNYEGSSVIFGSDTLPYPFINYEDYQNYSFVSKYDIPGTYTNYIGPPGTSNTIAVYPNPTNGSIYFTHLQAGDRIEVYDLLGELITSATGTGDRYSMDLSNKAKGIYLYRVTENGSPVGVGKVVVQ